MDLRVRCALGAALFGLVLTGTAGAAPITCATSGSYLDLLGTNAAGGCIVADKVFSNFTYQSSASGGANAVASGDFNYIAIANAPVAVGFQFQFGLTALANQTNDILISWLITGPNITSNHLVMAGNATGLGAASIVETFCKGGPIAGCPSGSADGLLVFANPPAAPVLSDEATFLAVGQLGIFKNINVSAGANGFATISGIVQTVDQIPNDEVPEPATMFIGGSALLGLALLRRRFRSQVN